MSFVLLSACKSNENNSGENSDTAGQDSTVTPGGAEGEFSMEKNGIKLTAYYEKDAFTDARLSLTSPTVENVTAGKTKFTFDVKNYELKMQSGDLDEKMCSNSDKGQHIHFILDNQPYTALYEPENEVELTEGYHFLLAFLSKSYHESIKHSNSFISMFFSVGMKGENPVDAKSPMMIYSRPRGEYIGKDTERLMLDFYLLNCDLSHAGYKVRATINGTEFTLEKWTAYFIEGLPKGEVKIKLELIGADGIVVPGPYNTVERLVTLKEEEPLS